MMNFEFILITKNCGTRAKVFTVYLINDNLLVKSIRFSIVINLNEKLNFLVYDYCWLSTDCDKIATKYTDFSVSYENQPGWCIFESFIEQCIARKRRTDVCILLPHAGCSISEFDDLASISPAGSWKNSQLGEISETLNARIINADLGGKERPAPALFPSRRQLDYTATSEVNSF